MWDGGRGMEPIDKLFRVRSLATSFQQVFRINICIVYTFIIQLYQVLIIVYKVVLLAYAMCLYMVKQH